MENINNNLIGKRYGYLTIINIKTKRNIICKCDCGHECNRQLRHLTNKSSCGECYKGTPYNDLLGTKIGYLTIINIYSNGIHKMAECKCSCGNPVIVTKVLSELVRKDRSHKTLSCGNCYKGISFNNYIGKCIGYTKIIDVVKKNYMPFAILKCSCGNTIERQLYSLADEKNYSSSFSCGECIYGKNIKTYIGEVYGYYKIIKIEKNEKKTYAYCTCNCNPNKIHKILLYSLINGTSKSCGCIKGKTKLLKQISFGNLRIITSSNNTIGGLRYICKCNCGNEIEVLESDLFTGKITCCKECLES